MNKSNADMLAIIMARDFLRTNGNVNYINTPEDAAKRLGSFIKELSSQLQDLDDATHIQSVISAFKNEVK